MATTLQELQTIIDYGSGLKEENDLQNLKLSIRCTVAALVVEDVELAINFLKSNTNINMLLFTSSDCLFEYLRRPVGPEGMIGHYLVKYHHGFYQDLLKSRSCDPAFVWFGEPSDKEAVARYFVKASYDNISYHCNGNDRNVEPFVSPADWAINSQWGLKGNDYFNPIYVALGDEIAKLITIQITADAVKHIPGNVSPNAQQIRVS